MDVVLSIVVLFNVAIAQPLLDLLGRNAEFFVARGSPRADVLVLALALTLLVPLAAGFMVRLTIRVHPRFGRALHLAILGSLVGALLVQLLKRVPAIGSLPGPALVAVSAVTGIGGAVFATRRRELRTILRWAAPVPVLVALLFLFVSPVSRLVLSGRVAEAAGEHPVVGDPAPIVMVIFDEFPLASLMDRHGEIDARLFPSFARLARDGTWFRNATTVHVSTTKAVPAILTGRLPDATSLPTAQDHPRNLFTLVRPQYDIKAIEPITDLCPEESCAESRRTEPARARWRALLSDLRVVSLHMLLPDDLTEGLPSIDNAWGGFGGQSGTDDDGDGGGTPQPARRQPVKRLFEQALAVDRQVVFEDFVASIERSPRPTLHFLHSMLPHLPWYYLSSGQRFELTRTTPGVGKQWSDEAWLVAQAYQRHLLQAQFVDRLVGRLLKRLERLELYEESLIVITSDHGASFQPKEFRRSIGPRTVGEIGAVPLFVKRPHQRTGGASDLPVQSIDILPTIADALDVNGFWRTDGASAFAPGFPQRTTKAIYTRGEPVVFGAEGRERDEIVRRKYSLFQDVGASLDLYRLGPHADLIGRRVASLPVGRDTPMTVVLDSPGAFDHVDPAAAVLPCLVTGQLRAGGPLPSPALLAVTLDGTIETVTQTFSRHGRENPFVALVPPRALRRGENRLSFFLIEQSAHGPALRRVALDRP